METYTHLIWDFNGTLLDDVQEEFEAANRLLRRHGLPALASVDVYRSLFRFPVIEYYRLIGFDFSRTPFAVLADEWMEDYRAHAGRLGLFPEIPGLLTELRRRGVRQSVLSATNRTMLEEQLRVLGVLSLFDEITGADDFHAYGKEHLAALWREAHPGARPLFIGDTDHDAEAARVMGADVILLECGHQSREKLEAAHPLLICARPGAIPFDNLPGPRLFRTENGDL